MSNLANAVTELEEEVASFHQGTKTQPRDGSTEWFLLRAKVIGLSYLKRIEQLGVESDAGACERVYKLSAKTFKLAEVPEAVEVEKERLPDGSHPSGRV